MSGSKLQPCRSADPANDRARRSLKALFGRIAIGFCVVFAGLALIASGGRTVMRELGLIGRLLHRAAPADDSGRVWGRALAAVGSDGVFVPGAHAFCDVQSQTYMSGKSGGWREDARQSFLAGYPEVTLEDGRTLAIAGEQIRFEPFVGVAPTSSIEAQYRRGGTGLRGPRLLAQCLQAGEVFVDGCVNAGGDLLVPCSDQAAVTITQGPRRVRLAQHVQAPALATCFFAVACTVILVLLAHRLRGRSSEASIGRAVGLAPRGLGGVAVADGTTKRMRWLRFVPVLLLPIFFGFLCRFTPCPPGLFWASLCLLPLSLGAFEPRGHAAALRTMLRTVVDRPTSPLASAEGDVVELAVRVAPNAPTTVAPLCGVHAAHVSVQVWERVVRWSGRSNTVDFVLLYAGTFFGDELPVHDATGSGTLDFGDAILDFEAGQSIGTSSEYPRTLRERTQMGGGEFLVRESVLLPGDALYVLGPVRRTPDPTAQGQFAYRAAPTTARVSPQADESDEERHPLFVHAGTEQSLLDAIHGGLARENTFSWVLGVAAALVATSLAALTLLCLV